MLKPTPPQSKWLRFVDCDDPATDRKTKRIRVDGQSDNTLGAIYWYAHWRRYTFHPLASTLYDVQCLADITAYITYLMDLRQYERKFGKTVPHEN